MRKPERFRKSKPPASFPPRGWKGRLQERPRTAGATAKPCIRGTRMLDREGVAKKRNEGSAPAIQAQAAKSSTRLMSPNWGARVALHGSSWCPFPCALNQFFAANPSNGQTRRASSEPRRDRPYDSSKWPASSKCTSSFSLESSARPERRWRTSSSQSGMGHLPEPLQCAKQFSPFPQKR